METIIKSQIKVRTIKNSCPTWDHYLSNHPESCFYHRIGWKHINEKNFGHECHYLCAEDGDEIVGILPIVFLKSQLFGRILSSMPFVNFGGICSNSSNVTALLLETARILTKDINADYLEIRGLKSLSDSLPTSLNKISMTLDLDKDPDVIWNGFKSKHRTNIRRVYKKDIHVKKGGHELLDEFYQIMAESWKRLGTPIYKKSYFKSILETFSNDTKIFIAYQGNRPIATAFNGYHNGVVEGMWAGSLPEYQYLQPNYVLYWEMIKDACENNFQHFHLGRSTVDTGAEIFKKKWNAYSRQLYWQYILNKSEEIPQLNVSNQKFQLAIKVWSKLPMCITTTIGPFIAKSIP